MKAIYVDIEAIFFFFLPEIVHRNLWPIVCYMLTGVVNFWGAEEGEINWALILLGRSLRSFNKGDGRDQKRPFVSAVVHYVIFN